MIYQNAHCFFFRKPHDLASTRGKQESFLDLLFEQEKSEIRASDLASIHQGIKEEFLAHCAAHDIDESEQSYEELIDQLKNTFTKEQEY